MGDLNLPGIDWNSNNLLDVCPKHRKSETLLELVEDVFLNQDVHTPTTQGNGRSNVVDVVFTNGESLVSDLSVRPPLYGSDHNILVYNYRICSYVKQSKMS